MTWGMQRFLKQVTERNTLTRKEKLNQTLSKFKMSAHPKHCQENHRQTVYREKILPSTHLTKDWYARYVKNSNNSIIKNEQPNLKLHKIFEWIHHKRRHMNG